MSEQKIAIASDHGGFELKKTIIAHLNDRGIAFEDMGCYSSDSVDYPALAFPLAEAVGSGSFDKGIIICGTGIGVSICANKVKNVRCALCGDPLSAKLTREHNNANVLAMGGRIVGPELAKSIVDAFLDTSFLGGRHERRVAMISDYEK